VKPSCAKKKEDKGDHSKANPDDASKADFSALWAQRFKQFFSARRQYLSTANVSQEEQDSEKTDAMKVAADKHKLEQIKEEYKIAQRAYLEDEVAIGRPALAEAEVRANKITESLRRGMGLPEDDGGDVELPSISGRGVVEIDVSRARQEL
jgi:hypothetical protein